jgi:S-adenosylmethionine hydrolase
MKWMTGALAGLIVTGRLWGAALVYQTDFGLKDGAVSAMKGVAFGVDPNLHQFDLTHEIPAFNIWAAAYRLKQSVPYWPSGTVFVNVVDPGVGTERRGIVAKTRAGHWIVTPDNGALTLLAENPGIEAVRVIDTARQRLPGSEASYTFHGRDVFAYVGARLASGQLAIDDIGPIWNNDIVRLAHAPATFQRGRLVGMVAVLDPQYGNVWSDIPKSLVDNAGLKAGDRVEYRLLHDGTTVHAGRAIFGDTFGQVAPGEPIVFLNSLLELSIALNQGNFAAKYHIDSGPGWSMEVWRAGH